MLSRFSARSYATASSSTFKLVTKEFESPVSKIQVVVKNAGSKSNDKTGLSHLVSNFNFLNTSTKSALRLKRESELLGGSYKSFVTRDDLILEASFLKEDLPYYLNAIGSTLSEASYKEHEFEELVVPTSLNQSYLVSKDSKFQALEKLNELTFKKGLGNSLYYDGVSKISLEEVKAFGAKFFNKSNLEIKSYGVVEKDLISFLDTSSFSVLSTGSSVLAPATKTYAGAEARLRLPSSKTTAVVGVAIPKGEEATYAALASLLTSKFPSSLTLEIESSIINYSDVSLFYTSLSSSDSTLLSAAIKSLVKELKSAKGLSKFAPAAELTFPGVSSKAVKDTVKFDKFNYAVVGNTDGLPFAEEL